MTTPATCRLATNPDVTAPDGCEVRLLPATPRGSMAHFTLPPGQTSRAVVHQTVEEIWYFLTGHGRMWRRTGKHEQIDEVGPEIAITIPTGSHFQLTNDGPAPLTAVAITIPPWPGEAEAVCVEGKWPPTVVT